MEDGRSPAARGSPVPAGPRDRHAPRRRLVLADWRTGVRHSVLMEQCYPHALAWSPDGTRLAASGPDGTAWVFGLDALGSTP
ncbi:hypothetical protein [Gemmata sp.]|uniref:hypothetical protein n=1 Tax=Gemmata sp. TaxID=1914242 RepID=UPI003F6E8254